MLRRPLHRGAQPPLCQLCEFIQARQVRAAKRPFVTLNLNDNQRAKIYQEGPAKSITIGLFAPAQTTSRVKQVIPSLLIWKRLSTSAGARPGAAAVACSTRAKQGAESPRPDGNHGENTSASTTKSQRPQPDLANHTELVTAVERVSRLFLAQQGIPSERTTLAALRACSNADVQFAALDEVQPTEHARRESQSETTASHLLDLDKNGRKARGAAPAEPRPAVRLQTVIDTMSEAAYKIISHPNVIITPRLLAEYIKGQARLGRPESLPQVLALYASKPRPKLVSGNIEYVAQNPDRMDHAVEAAAAETALDAAIEAKDLDAAIGVIENSYATKAFIRSKVLKTAVLPGTALALAPFAAYTIASGLSQWQTQLEPTMATNMAFVGIMAYLGFTATIGVVVVTTANDQMKRISWASGTPLRQRWLREEERAALDKVACSFGFSESHRFGEEEGAEFLALREYVLRRGMILDAVELMEGMV